MNTNTVVANNNPLIDKRNFRFTFRKDKLGNRRAPVELVVPVPSAEGVAAIVTNGGKPLDCLLEVVADFVRDQVASWVSDTDSAAQETFAEDKFDFAYLANLPKEDRRSATIPAEKWAAFASDYINIMPGRTGKTKESVELAAEIFVKKLLPSKTNKAVLTKLKEQLSIYSESDSAEEFEEVLAFLLKRLDTYLSAGEQVITEDMI